MTTEVAVNAVPINFNINNELTLLAWFFASLALKPLLLQPELHAGGAIYKVAIAFYDNPARYDRRYGAETPH